MYVYDILLTGSDTNSINSVIPKLKNRFEVVDLGETSYLLGLTIEHYQTTGSIELSVEAYARGLLEKFGVMESRPTPTPAEVGSRSTREKNYFRRR